MSDSPARKLIKYRLKVSDDQAERLAETVRALPKPTMSHERAVLDLLADRETMLEALDSLSDRLDQVKVERDDAHELASEKFQGVVAKLRGRLAVSEVT